MKIAFYQPHLCLRGTTVAIFDYAVYNESLLGNQSVVIYHTSHPFNDGGVINRFNQQLRTIPIKGVEELDRTLQRDRADAVYLIKAGFPDERISHVCKNLVHATGMAPPHSRHGDRFAYVSQWMSEYFGGMIPFVPHMVTLPSVNGNLRESLNIPHDAIVLGRTGGQDTWSLPWVTEVIIKSLAMRPDLYYIFQNTPHFVSHDRVKFIETSSDPEFKVRFINSCDGMIHARNDGESFGIACAEFSLCNKPIITWSDSPQKAHIHHLKDKGIYYRNTEDLMKILLKFKPQPELDWNCFKEFTPDFVMKRFKEVFLDSL